MLWKQLSFTSQNLVLSGYLHHLILEELIKLLFVTDNDMDLGTPKKTLNRMLGNSYEDDLPSDHTGTLCNDFLTHTDVIKRSQPLFIEANRYVTMEQIIVIPQKACFCRDRNQWWENLGWLFSFLWNQYQCQK